MLFTVIHHDLSNLILAFALLQATYMANSESNKSQ